MPESFSDSYTILGKSKKKDQMLQDKLKLGEGVMADVTNKNVDFYF